MATAPSPERNTNIALSVRGGVQGVGFRPCVCRTAEALRLAGFVRNGPHGVEIEAEGPRAALDRLFGALREVPAPARVDAIEQRPAAPLGGSGFRIETSASDGNRSFSLLPPGRLPDRTGN